MKSSNALVGIKTTKQFLILILLAFFSSYSIAQQKTVVVKTAPAVLQDFMDQRFGMFIHWGPVNLRGTITTPPNPTTCSCICVLNFSNGAYYNSPCC
jgi:hypothetical protein